MDIIIGSGKNRQKFVVATGAAMKDLAKKNPIEHAKIIGNLKAFVRRQPKVHVRGKIARSLKTCP